MGRFAQNEDEKRFESLWFWACMGATVRQGQCTPEESLNDEERAELADLTATIGEARAAELKATI